MSQSNPDTQSTAAPAIEQRIDKVIVQAIKTTYRDGRPIREDASQQVVVYRAAVSDVWTFLDKALTNGPRQDHSAGSERH